jgi:hypothetical protein
MPSPALKTIAIDDDLVVTSRFRTFDFKQNTFTAEGNVRATYDGEVITADRIVIYLARDQRRAVATGGALLTDPDGTVRATRLEFSWNAAKRYAKATEVVAKIAGSTIRAARADLSPTLWTFTNFSFTNDPSRHPLYMISGKSLTIIPKKVARINRPAVTILGHKILGWYGQRFNLDPAATGLRPPVPVYHDGSFGIDWEAGRPIAPSTTLEWHYDAYKGELPGSGIQLTHSYLPDTQAIRPIAPRSELLQRFEFGYFESILVKSPKAERDFLSQDRNAVTALENNNAVTTGRGAVNELFTFPIAGGYEWGGSAGSFGYLSDFRLETIRKVGDAANLTRAEAEGSLELPTVRLRPDLTLISRADAEGFQSDRSFGWARLSGGLVYQPIQALRLGAGLMGAAQGGTPDFDIDPLAYENGAMLRADYQLGPRQLGYMVRYSTRGGVFDNEVLITQAMGPLEAYFAYRQYPGDTRLGVTLRIEPLLDVLKRRHFGTPESSNPRQE